MDAKPQPERSLSIFLTPVQTLKKCAQAQYGEVSNESVGRLIEHSRDRMARLARHRGVSLRADWETARFDSGAPSQLAELGLQHILEGVLRCCGEGDGIWLHGEKGTDASIIRIHLSRRVLRKRRSTVSRDSIWTRDGPGCLFFYTIRSVTIVADSRQS